MWEDIGVLAFMVRVRVRNVVKEALQIFFPYFLGPLIMAAVSCDPQADHQSSACMYTQEVVCPVYWTSCELQNYIIT